MRRLQFSIVLLGLLCVPISADATWDVPEILRRLVEESEDPASVASRNRFAYRRASTVFYLDERGTTKKETLRIYHVAPENGRPVTRLVSIDGTPVGNKERERRSTAREAGDRSRGLVLSHDLIARYNFTPAGEELVDNRKTWVLRFAPKPTLETEGLMDKLINAMTGTIWVDQEEYQLARADLRLGRKVAFFGGIAGAIERLDIRLVQQRIEPAVWLNRSIHLDLAGRKLLSDVRFRCSEAFSDFVKVTEHASKSPY